MRNRPLVSSLLVLAALLLAFSAPVISQEPSAAGMVPVHMVVTAEAHHGAQEPDIRREDVTVFLGRTRTQVADWVPLRGEHSGLELFLLLDLCAISPRFESTPEPPIPTCISRQAREKTGTAERAGQDRGYECGIGGGDESLRSGWIVAFVGQAKGSGYDDDC